MKIILCFKTPDVVDDSLARIAEDIGSGVWNEDYAKKIHEMCRKFVKYGEYLTVEISDDSGVPVARVLERD